jgi:hypothetical protein
VTRSGSADAARPTRRHRSRAGIAALLAALVLTVLTGAAAAQDATVTYTDEPAPAPWQALLPVAADAWGGQQPDCPAGVAMTIMDDPGPSAARADVGGCHMWINRTQLTANASWEDRCKLVTHEWGHLLGHDHEPTGIMQGTPAAYDTPVPACSARYGVASAGFAPIGLAASCRWARRQALATLGRGWEVTSCRGGRTHKVLRARWRRDPRQRQRVDVTRPERHRADVIATRIGAPPAGHPHSR